MSASKFKGLVLKYSNMNDNDRLFTLFCPELGKVTALSKGIRSHKHKDFAALQSFCYSDFVIDTSKGLGYISSAQVIENFFDIRSSVEKMSLASYVSDLVSLLADEFMYNDDFFRFILNTLYMISKADDDKVSTMIDKLILLKTIFEFKSVCEAGYSPCTDRCGVCGAVKELEYFDIYNGSVICKNCFDSGRSAESVEVGGECIALIHSVCTSDLRSVFRLGADSDVLSTCSGVSETYLINKLEIVSAKLEYFKNIINS